MPAGAVSVSLSGDRCELSGGKTRFSVPSRDWRDFPEQRPREGGACVSMDATEWEVMARRVVKACQKEKANAVLEGVNVACDGSTLTMAATDSYKLAVVERPCESEPFDVTVKPALLDAVGRMEGEASLSVDGNLAALSCDGSEFSMPVLSGKYPAWRRLVPPSCESECTVGRDSLAAALGRASLAVKSNSSAVRLSCSGGALAVSAVLRGGDDVGFEESVDCDGGEFEIGVMPSFLRDMALSQDCDALRLQFTSTLAPLVLRGMSTTALVMPVRL